MAEDSQHPGEPGRDQIAGHFGPHVQRMANEIHDLVTQMKTDRDAGEAEENEITDIAAVILAAGDVAPPLSARLMTAIRSRGDRHHRRGSLMYATANAIGVLTEEDKDTGGD